MIDAKETVPVPLRGYDQLPFLCYRRRILHTSLVWIDRLTCLRLLTVFRSLSNVEMVERRDGSNAPDDCIRISINFYACIVRYT
jgi:hypothetical protein